MKKDFPEPITTAGVETFLAAGNPSLNLLRVEPVSRSMLPMSMCRS